MADELDRDQLERIRQKAYDIVASDPGGPNADQARRILSKLPKVNVGRKDPTEGRSPQVHGELAASDEGGLPPTPDEAVGIPNHLEQMSLPQRAAVAALSPSSRREFERGASNMLTFGLGQKVAGPIGRALGDQPDVDIQATEAKDAQESPNARGAGEIAAVLTGKGLAGGAARLGRTAFSKVAAAGHGLPSRMVSSAVAGAGANEVAMPLIRGGQEAVASGAEDETLGGRAARVGQAMKEEALNPVNAVAGALLGAPSGLSRSIREHGRVGRDIRLTEQYGAKPGPMGPKGGIFDSPIMRDVEGTARDQGAMSRKVADKVLEGIGTERSALSREYAASKAEADSLGQLEGKIDPVFVKTQAEQLMNGAGLTASERAAVQREVLDVIDQYPAGMSVDEFNDFRGKLGRIFGVGPGETSVPALDQLRQSAKRTVDETEMGPINERYSKGRERIQRQHEQLGISEEARPDRQARSLANSIAQRAEQERTAGVRAEGELGIDQFLKENPRYQSLFDLPELLAAKERMTMGIEPEAGFHRRMGSHILHKNIEPALVGAYRLTKPAENLTVPAAVAARYLLTGETQ